MICRYSASRNRVATVKSAVINGNARTTVRESDRINEKRIYEKRRALCVSPFLSTQTFFSFGRRMIVSVTVCRCERDRGNPALLSGNSILAAVTTSLFSSVIPFSSLVRSVIIAPCIAELIEQTLVPMTFSSLMTTTNKISSHTHPRCPIPKTNHETERRGIKKRERKRKKKEIPLFFLSVNTCKLVILQRVWIRSSSSHRRTICKYKMNRNQHDHAYLFEQIRPTSSPLLTDRYQQRKIFQHSNR